ncbi:hypothetical protein [Paraglaciecola sp.]|uniref:hypothetical protein n=1 Tax=Paraglaciecola sp. TaxID=1920173 RepID=UPI0030F37E5D
MKMSKTTLAMLLTVSVFGLSACSEASKDKTAEVEKAAAAKMEQVKENTSEVMDDVSDATSDVYESAKDGVEDMMDVAEEEGAELKEDGLQKLKEACIASKEATDGDPTDC